MCKAMAELTKATTFKNMIKDGLSHEQAQKYTEISDELAEKALAELHLEITLV